MSNTVNSGSWLGVHADANSSTTPAFNSPTTVYGPTPRSGTLRNLRAAIDAAPGAGRTWQIRVQTGTSFPLADSTVLCTITAPATTCDSGATSVAVPAGSYFSIRVTRTAGSGDEKRWRYSFEY
jgi:hypothetical protein